MEFSLQRIITNICAALAILLISLPNALCAHSADFSLNLTPEESKWLKENPKLILGLDPEWAPFSFINKQGKLEGIDNDFLTLICERLGVSFELRKTKAWEETNQAIMLDEFHIVSGISPNEQRLKKLTFTAPYASFPTAIITRLDGPFFSDLAHLKDAKFASPRSYITTDLIKKNYPEIFVTETPTLMDALTRVSRGDADFAFENLASASHLIREHGLTNLKISGIGDMQFKLHFATRNDLPFLSSAVDKALASITSQQRAKIFADWVYIPREEPSPLKRYWVHIVAVLGAVSFVLAGFWYWNLILARELEERRRIEAELIVLNDEKSRFMSMAAHDINNPLTVISMNCQVAISRLSKSPDGDIAPFKDIQKHCKRISYLINSLLTSNPVVLPEEETSAQIADFSEITRKVAESYTHRAQSKKITISQKGPSEPLLIRADPDRVMQVIENLISNAVKFSPHSGEVTVSHQAINGMARLEISDTGPGISEADRPRLFGWFSRLSATPTGEEESHGLGLFIVKELVDEMKGKVWLASSPGQGAKFCVEFPLAVK